MRHASEDQQHLNESWTLFTGDREARRSGPVTRGQDRGVGADPPGGFMADPGPDDAPAFKTNPGRRPTRSTPRCTCGARFYHRRLGSGKSTLVEVIAKELELGGVLRWHVTSRTTLHEGLYEYDALGRLHATQAAGADVAPANFVRLGPLGTALATGTVRAVLIDELDKSDLDLPGDLLNVMEDGEFRIPVLARAKSGHEFFVTGADGDTGQDGLPYRSARTASSGAATSR